MESRTIYSMMALSIMPGAMQAAVGVQSGTALVSADNKVEVDFGTLVPGTYLFTGVVTDGSVTSATLGIQNAVISGSTITATLVLEEETAVKFIANGAAQFTLGAYDLKLNWEPNADALNTLYDAINTKVTNTWAAILTDEHKTALSARLATQKGYIETIEAAATDADKYKVYTDYKLYNEPDDITAALNAIQATADQNYIDDCFAKKTEAYNTFLTDFNAVSLAELQTEIDGLTDTKEKRQTALTAVQAKLDAFKAGADAALGQKAEDVAEATDEFNYVPDPDLATIQAEIDALEDLVAQDKANTTKFNTLKTNQAEAVTLAEALQAKVAAQKNVGNKTANTTTADGYATQLADYLADAQAAYTAAVEGDAAFGYDLDFSALDAIKADIADLSATVDAQNEAYETANTTIQGYFAAALENYNTELTAVTEAITEDAYADILEKAQSDLLTQKTALTEAQDAYTLKYTNGEDLDAATAEDAVDAINTAVNGIATDATAEAEGYRTLYNDFAAQIAAQKARLDAITGAEDYGQIQGVIGEDIAELNGQLEELESNLALANKADAEGNHTIGNPGYVPTAYDGTTTVADVQHDIDAIDVDQIKDELAAYNAATNAIAAAQAALTAAQAAVAEADDVDAYDAAARWQAVTDGIAAELEASQAEINALYGDGKGTDVQTAGFTTTAIEAEIAAYETNAKAAIAKYKEVAGKIATGQAALTELDGKVKDLSIYTDKVYVYADPAKNYGEQIAAIQAEIDAVQGALDASNEENGAENLAALNAIVYSETNIDNKITELTNSYQTDQANYEEAVAATVVESLGATFASTKTALTDAIAASKTEKTALDLGIKATEISDAYDALATAAAGLGLDVDDDTAVKKVQKYNELLGKIGKAGDAADAAGTYYAQLAKIEADANAAAQAKAADDAAQAALAESKTALDDARTAAGAHVAAECADVPTSYDFTDIDTAIAELETAIGDAATAQNTVEKKDDLDAEITRISGLIQAEVEKADKAQAKFTANANLTTKYNAVNSYLGEQRAQVGAVAGATPDEYDQTAINTYKDKFNGEEGFVEQLAAIKADIQAKYESDAAVSEYESNLTAQLDALQTEIGKVLPAAQANKASYDTQLAAYNDAVDVYNTNNTKLNDPAVYPEQETTVITDAKAEMAAQQALLDNALASIQNNYGAGEAVDNENTNVATVGEIAAAIESIITTLDGGTYAEAISQQNQQIYADAILPALQDIQDAYAAAVAVLNDYEGAQNAGIKALVDANKTDLNNAVFEAPQTKTAFNGRATDEKTAANEAGTLWDTTAILADIADYVTELNTVKADFTTAIEGAIVGYWTTQKGIHTNAIADAYSRLNSKGYNPTGKTEEEVFAQQYAWIGQGDAITAPEEGPISITALDNLLATDGFSSATYEDNIKRAATEVANAFVLEKIAEYTAPETGKVAVAEAEIAAIIADGYDLPEGETSIEEQLQTLKTTYVDGAETWRQNWYANGLMYDCTYTVTQNAGGLLAAYDTGIEALEVTAQQWADDKAARVAAKATLTENVATATAAVEELEGKIAKTSVAEEYADEIAAIKATISEANEAETTDAIAYAKEDLAAIDLTTLEANVVDAVQAKANTQVDDLKAQFNQYAAVEGANAEKVDDLNTRIHGVIATIADPGATIDDAIALEQEVELLQTELAQLNDADFVADVQALADRAAALQAATLDEADYGDKAEDFASRLEAIKAAGAEIAANIEAHKEAQNIKPYMTGIESDLTIQEAALETLKSEAAEKAGQVAESAALYADFSARLEALQTATLPEADYGDAEGTLNSRLTRIQNDATRWARWLENDKASLYEDFRKDAYETNISTYEGQLETLLTDAAAAAEAREAQKTASDGVYATLSDQVAEAETAIAAAVEAINGMSVKDNYSNDVDWLNSDLTSIKTNIENEKEAYTLTEVGAENYTGQLETLLTNKDLVLNWAAYNEARALYVSNTSNLQTAKTNAWNAWRGWSFASTVKAALQQELKGYDGEVTTLSNQISSDQTAGNSYAQLATYAETAEAIIAEYEAIVDRMANFKPFGDANADGKVNVLDYQKVANMILDPTLQPAEGDDLFLVTDINQNEVIEVGDLTAIVNYILNKDWGGYDEASARRVDGQSESLTMSTSRTQQGTTRIAVNLNNVDDYTAFQMDIVLPEGMKMVGKSLSDRAGKSHSLWSRTQQDGSIRLLASSIKGETFSGNEGAVLYIDVETNADYVSGNLELLNILFSSMTSGTRAFNIGAGDATGINTIGTLESLKQKVYDLGGRVMSGLKKGVNIIRRADGSTQKVMK